MERVRRLREEDRGAAERVRAACSADEWEHGGVELGARDTWAAFEGAQLVALGQLRAHGSGAADPCVVTHPAHRGRGCGRGLVSAVAKSAVSEGTLVLYQTLLSNEPALAVARRIGFEAYATLLAIRIDPCAVQGGRGPAGQP
jgi:predicted GNAT family acetyltransferase